MAARHAMEVTLVAASPLRRPEGSRIALVVVGEGIDVADDYIAERAEDGDIVVTADIPLAARCLARGARVIGTTGLPFTAENIGTALATRSLLADLRDLGEVTGGPRPFTPRDRSRFLQRLDDAAVACRRRAVERAAAFNASS